jgi:hypothetical protein
VKGKFKISARERWFVAFAPCVAIGGFYLLAMVGNLTTQLQTAQDRARVAFAPVQQDSVSPALTKAKAGYETVRRSIDDHNAAIAQMEQQLDATNKTIAAAANDNDAAEVIGRVEAIFARNGIKPLISEAADADRGTHGVPTALVDALSPKTEFDTEVGVKGRHVWHLIFDDQMQQFEQALQQVTQDDSAVVPLSLNLVYNPQDDGQSRLLELWLLY